MKLANTDGEELRCVSMDTITYLLLDLAHGFILLTDVILTFLLGAFTHFCSK
jgi:hypothetical protein